VRAFISYARQDQDFALRLASSLKERGVPIWLDQWDISAGADWDQAIDRALSECGKLVVILSDAAVSSKQVRGEIQAAFDNNKTIVPVLHEKCTVPRVLRLIQHIDFTGRIAEAEAVEQLAHVLRDQTSISSEAVVPTPARKPNRNRRFLLVGVVAATVLIVGGGWYTWQTASDQSAMATRSKDSSTESGKSTPLRPKGYGRLNVSVNVDAAKVSVDGESVGTARRIAPLSLSKVAAGTRRVRIEADGYEPAERRVYIVADESMELPVKLFVENPKKPSQ
jgi:hypothetical protein